jgi:signal transduction histidine kinase
MARRKASVVEAALDSADEARLLADARAQALDAVLLDRADGAAVWSGAELKIALGVAEPLGRLPDARSPEAVAAVLAGPAFSSRLATAFKALIEDGVAFEQAVNAPGGGGRRVVGRTLGGRAMLNVIEGDGDGRALTADEARLRRADKSQAELSESFAHAPIIAWRRDLSGGLTWINRAYVDAVRGESADTVIAGQTELLFGDEKEALRDLAERARTTGRPATTRASTVIGDEKQKLDFLETPVMDGSVGFAIDRTAQVTAVEALKREVEANQLVLDRLRRGVALFTKDLTLSYFNDTVAALWGLDSKFLHSNPGLRDILNALREQSMVPEARNFTTWRRELVDRFQKLSDCYDERWHLPNGTVLHLIAEPHPLGGIVLMVEDISEMLEMQREIRSVSLVQNAALSKLREGVLVLGLDGRRRLSNRAFGELWRLDEQMLDNAHIREIAALCEPLFGDHGVWSRMIEFVSGATEARGTWYETLERSDGSVLGMAGTVLPDGATMFGFTDVTDSIHKERVLREQNDKLEELSGLKSAFLDGIHGASNELKIPLNTIIGFSEILGQEYFGALNEQQREYIEGVGTAAADLRTLVSNITDLAMIQADDFPFQLEQIDLKPVIEATVRFIERSGTGTISLKLDCPDTIGEVPGDSPRFREILHNLINAVHGDLEEGAVIEVGVRRQERMMLLWIGAEDAALSGSTWQLLDSATQGLDAPPVQREGLGVTLARQFVERQGGTVGVERGIGRTKEAIVCRFLTDEASVRAAIGLGRRGRHRSCLTRRKP